MMNELFNVRIGEVAKIQNGYAFKSKEYVDNGLRIIRIANVQTGEIIDRDPKFYPSERLDEFDEYLIEEDDFLISLTGNAGRVGRIKKELLPALLNQRVGKFNFLSNLVLRDFLFHYLNSRNFIHQVIKSSKGVAQLNTSSKKIEDILLPISSLPEQRAIVAKIEELFSDLDNGIDDLKKAQEQLKIYRQAVLKKAFEESPNTERKNIVEIVTKVQIGPFGSQLHKEDYIVNGIPLINPMHIQEGKIKPNETYTISVAKRDSLPNYILEEDDIIMGRRGEMGRCGLVSEKEVGWFCGTGSLYLRPIKEIAYAPFLFYYMSSSTVKKFLTGSAKGTTMMNLNKKIVSNIPINLPKTVNEQRQIVREIESRLSVCDKVEESITESLEKAKALRQSILKKAFEGKLLSAAEIEKCKQAPDYEPASVLVEKIKKEKNKK